MTLTKTVILISFHFKWFCSENVHVYLLINELINFFSGDWNGKALRVARKKGPKLWGSSWETSWSGGLLSESTWCKFQPKQWWIVWSILLFWPEKTNEHLCDETSLSLWTIIIEVNDDYIQRSSLRWINLLSHLVQRLIALIALLVVFCCNSLSKSWS